MAPLVQLDDVNFSYQERSPTEVLSGISLGIDPGEFLCLLGPSGCGKTSVLKLIAGFEFPTSGQILLEGRPVDGPGADRAVVFQGDDSLYPWLTTLDNIAFGLKLAGVGKRDRKDQAARYARLVGLGDHYSKYPHELSGGMKQRVQIARVLANNPQMLLMDEPFAAVDAQTRLILQDELVRIWQDTRKSILFITHDIAESILLGQRIAIMSDGPHARVAKVMEVDLPRPRQRGSTGFGALYDEIGSVIAARDSSASVSR